MSMASNKFMAVAISEARRGVRRNDGGPFGACVVFRGRVLVRAHNTVLRDRDATAHAEINVIRAACRRLKTFDLSGCELYSTTEPCPMCLGALHWARITRLIVGVGRAVAARYGFGDARFYRELVLPPEKRCIRTKTGVMRRECLAIFETWQKLGRELY